MIRRDRSGHGLIQAGLLTAAVLAAVPAAAAPGDYKARRFDVVARAVDGRLDVTESIAFDFQSGTFTKVWREIPATRTDGIEIVGAGMDGNPFTPGDGPGHFTVSGRTRLRVEWHFAETGPSAHRFDLRYVARGVVYREGDSEVLRWRALPAEHRYRIDASRITFEPAGAHAMPPEASRTGSVAVHASNEGVTIDATAIQSNGSIVAELRYPAGTLTRSQPAWLERQTSARALGPRWAMGGGAIFVIALLVLMVVRQGYQAPETFPDETTTTEPPQELPAAIATALVAKARLIGGQQAIGTLLDLADRGILTVQEMPSRLGARRYELSQVPGRHDLERHEEEVLSIAFADRGDDVSFVKAAGRLRRAGRRFAAAVHADLAARGLTDPDRKAAHDRLGTVALGMIPLAVLVGAIVAALVPRYGAWPFLLPLGLAVAGIVGLVLSATTTSLSDQGLVEAARWRGFRRHLKTLASGGERSGNAIPSRWIVYAIAVGLGHQWSRYLKRNPGLAPPWFVAAGPDADAAFAAFVGSHSAGAAGGGAGGAAAGGGGSGAG
jgi:Predicted membrane protein (DUF2207) C-terminal domain/Predicted membrane protein (DUF2207) N-terminal domain